jgi:hypothetical protein
MLAASSSPADSLPLWFCSEPLTLQKVSEGLLFLYTKEEECSGAALQDVAQRLGLSAVPESRRGNLAGVRLRKFKKD